MTTNLESLIAVGVARTDNRDYVNLTVAAHQGPQLSLFLSPDRALGYARLLREAARMAQARTIAPGEDGPGEVDLSELMP